MKESWVRPDMEVLDVKENSFWSPKSQNAR